MLTELKYKDGRFIAKGLQDPLTVFKPIDERVLIQSMPFISLDDDIIKRRVSALLNDSNISVTVENQSVTLTGASNKLPELQQKHLDVIYQSYMRLSNINNGIRVKLSSRSDCQGSVIESNKNNQSRLTKVENYLTLQGINREHMVTETIECAATSTVINPEKIGVWFEVIL